MTRPVPLTAIVTCRNAADTLAALLDHFAWHGAEVIVIDHGSTDETPAIAAGRMGSPVRDIVTEPFRGVFDLTAQLRRKAAILSDLPPGWVIHADADEFLDTPDGSPLADYLAHWDATDRIALGSREFLFLPLDDLACHQPESFQDTMRHYVPLAERDPKQRVFRSSAPLDMWHATGGHTVTLDPARIAPRKLRLRHYLGLSLDRIRAQYLSRVFSHADIAKRWHRQRLTAEDVTIVAPPAGALQDIDRQGWDHGSPVRQLPVFTPRVAEPGPALPDSADLWVVASGRDLAAEAIHRIAAQYPGLRLGVVSRQVTALSDRRPAAILHLLQHPGVACATDDPRMTALDWVRRIAAARQIAQFAGVRYTEMRIEDLAAKADGWTHFDLAVRALILGEAGCTLVTGPTHNHVMTQEVTTIAGPLARDLGYT